MRGHIQYTLTQIAGALKPSEHGHEDDAIPPHSVRIDERIGSQTPVFGWSEESGILAMKADNKSREVYKRNHIQTQSWLK